MWYFFILTALWYPYVLSCPLFYFYMLWVLSSLFLSLSCGKPFFVHSLDSISDYINLHYLSVLFLCLHTNLSSLSSELLLKCCFINSWSFLTAVSFCFKSHSSHFPLVIYQLKIFPTLIYSKISNMSFKRLLVHVLGQYINFIILLSWDPKYSYYVIFFQLPQDYYPWKSYS